MKEKAFDTLLSAIQRAEKNHHTDEEQQNINKLCIVAENLWQFLESIHQDKEENPILLNTHDICNCLVAVISQYTIKYSNTQQIAENFATKICEAITENITQHYERKKS